MAKVDNSNALRSLYMVFDTETTGFSYGNNDVVQIAGIIFRDGLEQQRFNFTCKPFRWDPITQDAMDINGHTLEKMKAYADPVDVCKVFRDIVMSYASEEEPMQLVAHNCPFDRGFTKAWFEKCGFSDFDTMFTAKDDCICTKKWGNRGKKQHGWDMDNMKLITAASFIGFSFDAHDAMGDTLACCEWMKYLLSKGVCVVTGGPSAEELHDEGKLTEEEMQGTEAEVTGTEATGSISL